MILLLSMRMMESHDIVDDVEQKKNKLEPSEDLGLLSQDLDLGLHCKSIHKSVGLTQI